MKYVALLAVVASAATAAADTPRKKPPAAPAGTVQGTVIFEGEAPDNAQLVRDSDPYCAKTPRLADDVVVTKGKLKDVVVRVKNAPASSVRPKGPVLLDQKECMYAPRVVTVAPGQRLAVRNSDGTFHNVNGSIRGKLLWNKPQAAKDPDLTLDQTARAGDVIDVVCNVHPWMHAYAVVVDHPFVAITGTDGKFTISGLPPGKYTLEAWHPTLGTRTLDIRIGTGAKATVPARISYKKT